MKNRELLAFVSGAIGGFAVTYLMPHESRGKKQRDQREPKGNQLTLFSWFAPPSQQRFMALPGYMRAADFDPPPPFAWCKLTFYMPPAASVPFRILVKQGGTLNENTHTGGHIAANVSNAPHSKHIPLFFKSDGNEIYFEFQSKPENAAWGVWSRNYINDDSEPDYPNRRFTMTDGSGEAYFTLEWGPRIDEDEDKVEVGPGKIQIFVNFLVPCEVWIEGVPGSSGMQVLKVGKDRLAPFRVHEALPISFQGRPIQYGSVSEAYQLTGVHRPVENVRNATNKVVELWGTNIDKNDPNYNQGQLQAVLTFTASNIPQSLPPTRPKIVVDFERYSDPDGCMALNPGSTASPSTDNSMLFTAEKLVVIGPTRDGEVEWFRKHILSCIDPNIGFIRHPNKREPTSYDDFIGAFAFLKKYNYINDARALRNFMEQRDWKNGDKHLGLFRPQLTAFSVMCVNEDPGIGGLLGIKAAFLWNSGIEAPLVGRIWAESKDETNGKCLLYLMTRIIEGHGHIWQAVVDDWHKFIQQTYGRRQMREVYKIYFGFDHPITKYAKPW